MGEAAGGGTRRKPGGEGTGGGGGQRREEGSRGQAVPGVTGAWVLDPQGMCDRHHREALQTPVCPPQHSPPTLYCAGALGGWARRHPALPIASPQTHSHTTVPHPGASPCQPGQGTALVPAPSGQGDQGDRADLSGVDRWGELWAPKEEEAGRGHLLGSA